MKIKAPITQNIPRLIKIFKITNKIKKIIMKDSIIK